MSGVEGMNLQAWTAHEIPDKAAERYEKNFFSHSSGGWKAKVQSSSRVWLLVKTLSGLQMTDLSSHCLS